VGGRIIVQQEKISRAESSWTNSLNALQEAIHYSFIKLCIYCFSLWYEFFVYYALRVEKNWSTWSWCGTFGISVSSTKGMSHQPIQNSVALFQGHGQNIRAHLSKIILLKVFVCIDHRDNVLARCGSIFPLISCQEVWNKTCTQLSFRNLLSESEELLFWGCSKILLPFLMRFDGHSWPNQQPQQCLPHFELILDRHLSRHLLPAPFRLEIENTT